VRYRSFTISLIRNRCNHRDTEAQRKPVIKYFFAGFLCASVSLWLHPTFQKNSASNSNQVSYTEFALCVSPNALCSTTYSISCSQSHVSNVTLQFKSVGGEGHVRNAGPAWYRSIRRSVHNAASPPRQSKASAAGA